MTLYPVSLVVEGRPCLVVGGGRVAARKVSGLLDGGAVVTVVAPEFSEELMTLAGTATILMERRSYRLGESAHYRLVLAASDDGEVNRAVFDDAEAAGVWVNVADDPAFCSFVLPAVLRRGPLSVAVSTEGRSPAFASWLRTRLEAMIGDEYRQLLELVAQEREAIRASGRSSEGLDWQRAMDSNMLELIRAGQIGKARERLQACLSSS